MGYDTICFEILELLTRVKGKSIFNIIDLKFVAEYKLASNSNYQSGKSSQQTQRWTISTSIIFSYIYNNVFLTFSIIADLTNLLNFFQPVFLIYIFALFTIQFIVSLIFKPNYSMVRSTNKLHRPQCLGIQILMDLNQFVNIYIEMIKMEQMKERYTILLKQSFEELERIKIQFQERNIWNIKQIQSKIGYQSSQTLPMMEELARNFAYNVATAEQLIQSIIEIAQLGEAQIKNFNQRIQQNKKFLSLMKKLIINSKLQEMGKQLWSPQEKQRNQNIKRQARRQLQRQGLFCFNDKFPFYKNIKRITLNDIFKMTKDQKQHALLGVLGKIKQELKKDLARYEREQSGQYRRKIEVEIKELVQEISPQNENQEIKEAKLEIKKLFD